MEGRKSETYYSISCWGVVKTTKRSKKVKELLYSSTFRGNKVDTAKQKYAAHQKGNGHHGLITEPSRLAVSLDTPWLAASPTGTVPVQTNVWA